MKQTYRHIMTRHSNRHRSRLLLSLLLLCLTACSPSDEDQTNPGGGQDKTATQLYIYVHAPQTAVPTRAYEGDVDPINNEAKVYSLQIWVFIHDTNKLIGYFSPSETSILNRDGYEVYQLTIDEDYAQTAEVGREHVDVYVLANVKEENCHLTLDHMTTREELEAAVLANGTTGDAFGLNAPVTTVPENLGLPMSGVLRDQVVTGTAPVLRLGDGEDIASVSLIRTISKLRFAFANQTGNEALVINSIKLNSTMIPEAQYLFMAEDAPYNRKTCHIKTESGYNETASELLAESVDNVPAIEQPVIYAWGNEEMEPQAYERMLDDAAAAGDLTQRMYFLRESDKQLQGEIKYQLGDGEE